MEKKSISHVLAGLLIAAVMIVYSMILTFTDLNTNRPLSFITYLIFLGGLIYFILEHARSKDHTLGFGALFTYGFKATAVSTLVMIGFQLLFFLILPEYKDKMLELSRTEMLKQGQVTEEQIEMAMETVQKFFWPGLIGGILFFSIFVGAIGSLIGAGVAKKVPQSPFQ